ncbi:MAG: hypothetical protein ACT4NL_17880 [Pseudomarimonas sp.]
MRSLVFAIFTLVLPVLTLPTVALAQDFSSLEERMSASEFKAAGLEKLSADELNALNLWLRQRATTSVAGSNAYSAAQPDPNDLRGLPSAPSADGDIVSRIPGVFKGWSGRTRFELENGQVWEGLPENDSLAVNLVDPVVRIKKGLVGTWFLKVDGYNKAAKVRRIR